MAPRVAIVDYGTGNIASLEAALSLVGARVSLAVTPDAIDTADALVLPGVGHFGPASEHLRRSGLEDALKRRVLDGLPVLGICLGFQLLTASSEEAPQHPGLAMLPQLHSIRIRPADPRIHKVPHLGWNNLEHPLHSPRLLHGIEAQDQLFYFANAYAIEPSGECTAATACYHHDRPWLALVEQDNIYGVQFHPEKSRRQGLQLLRNFLAG